MAIHVDHIRSIIHDFSGLDLLGIENDRENGIQRAKCAYHLLKEAIDGLPSVTEYLKPNEEKEERNGVKTYQAILYYENQIIRENIGIPFNLSGSYRKYFLLNRYKELKDKIERSEVPLELECEYPSSIIDLLDKINAKINFVIAKTECLFDESLQRQDLENNDEESSNCESPHKIVKFPSLNNDFLVEFIREQEEFRERREATRKILLGDLERLNLACNTSNKNETEGQPLSVNPNTSTKEFDQTSENSKPSRENNQGASVRPKERSFSENKGSSEELPRPWSRERNRRSCERSETPSPLQDLSNVHSRGSATRRESENSLENKENYFKDSTSRPDGIRNWRESLAQPIDIPRPNDGLTRNTSEDKRKTSESDDEIFHCSL